MAVSLVQSAKGTWTSGASMAVTFTPAANNLLAIAVIFEAGNSSNDVQGIADGANTYELIDTLTEVASGLTQRLALYYVKKAAGGATTITVSFLTSNVNLASVVVHEYSGAAWLDQYGIQKLANPGTGTDAVTSPTVVTETAGQAIFGAVKLVPDGAVTFTAGTDYTVRQSQANHGATEDRIQPSAGSVAATFTASIDWAAIYVAVATFRPAISGSGFMVTNRWVW